MSRYLPDSLARPRSKARSLAAKHVEEAIREIHAIAKNAEVDPKTRLLAWGMLLERAEGKPAQEVVAKVEVSDADGLDINAEIASLVAAATGEADAGSTGEPH